MELLPNSNEHEVIEKYKGTGFQSQGQVESTPKRGYKSWKKGVRLGVDYALSVINDNRKFKVSILALNGLTTDTNPIILAFVASRAILQEFENQESKADLTKIEEIVYNSWNYKYDSQLDFANNSITKG